MFKASGVATSHQSQAQIILLWALLRHSEPFLGAWEQPRCLASKSASELTLKAFKRKWTVFNWIMVPPPWARFFFKKGPEWLCKVQQCGMRGLLSASKLAGVGTFCCKHRVRAWITGCFTSSVIGNTQLLPMHSFWAFCQAKHGDSLPCSTTACRRKQSLSSKLTLISGIVKYCLHHNVSVVRS